MTDYIPINKGNYSLDTPEREALFDRNRAAGVEEDYRRNRREWEEFPRSFHVAEYPLLVDLELSTACNLKCPFCYTITEEFKQKVRARLMDFSLFQRIIDEIGGKVFAIRLSLRGEPTLHPRFIDAIRYAKSKGIREVSTLTNGSRLEPDFFTSMMEAGLDWLTISFDGIGAVYEQNRKPLLFEEMCARLRAIRELKRIRGKVKPVIKLQTVWPAIAEDPAAYYDAMAPLCDLLAFNPLIDFTPEGEKQPHPFVPDFHCPQIYQRLVIGSDGRALLCANDERGEVLVGDANTQTIRDIWHGPALSDARARHRRPDGFLDLSPCRKCYLPRRTREEPHRIHDREFIVRNYI